MKGQEPDNQFHRGMSFDTSTIEVDIESIRRAVDEGIRLGKRRRKIRENIIFIALAVALFTLSGVVVVIGYGHVVVIVEIIIAVIVPFSVPLIMRHQVRGGA